MNPALKQRCLLSHGEGQLGLAIISSSTFTQKAFVLYWDMPWFFHPGLLQNKTGWRQMIYNEAVDDWNWKCSSDAQHVFFKCFPTATLLQRIKPRGHPGSTPGSARGKVDCTKWARKAGAWRTRPGIWEGGKGLPALLAAVSLETAIQTLRKTVLDGCVFTNL